MKPTFHLMYFYINIIFFILCLSTSGCTLVGLGLGSISDYHHYHDNDQLIANLKKGDKIRIIFKDLSSVEGAFENIVPFDSIIYAQKYSEFKNNIREFINLPSLGDTLYIFNNNQEYKVVFRGFGINALYVNIIPYSNLAIYPYENISRLENQNKMHIDINKIINMKYDGKLPLNEFLVLKYSFDKCYIDYYDIKFIELRNRYARWIGAGLGFIIDAIIIISIINFHMDLSTSNIEIGRF